MLIIFESWKVAVFTTYRFYAPAEPNAQQLLQQIPWLGRKACKNISHLYLLQPWKWRHKFSTKPRQYSPHQQFDIPPKKRTRTIMLSWPPRLAYCHFGTYFLFTLSWSINSNEVRQTDIQPEERNEFQARTFSPRRALPLQIHTLWIYAANSSQTC